MRLMLVAIDEADQSSLMHYRTRGSKNGQRRYQDASGRLTPEGYQHYKEMYGWGDREAAKEETGSGRSSNQNDVPKQNHGSSYPEPSSNRRPRGTSEARSNSSVAGPVVDVKSINKALDKHGDRAQILQEAHTIPKGTVIYRTTAGAEDGKEGTTYVSYTNMDREHYRGGWIRQQGNTGKAYEHTYTLNEDLHVPSRDTTRKVINDVLSKNPELVKETCAKWLDMVLPKGSWARAEAIDNQIQNMLVKEANKRGGNFWDWPENVRNEYRQKAMVAILQESVKSFGDKTLNEAAFYTMQTLGTNVKVRNQVIRELQRQGYNAMTDEASVGGQNGWAKEGGDPLIIFERSGLLSETSTKEISRKDEAKSSKKYNKTRQKASANRTGAWSATDQKWEEVLMHAEANGFDGTKTIQEILETLTDEQMAAVAYLLYQNKSQESDKKRTNNKVSNS